MAGEGGPAILTRRTWMVLTGAAVASWSRAYGFAGKRRTQPDVIGKPCEGRGRVPDGEYGRGTPHQPPRIRREQTGGEQRHPRWQGKEQANRRRDRTAMVVGEEVMNRATAKSQGIFMKGTPWKG